MQDGPLPVALPGCGTLAEILADQVYPAVHEDLRVVAAIGVRPERARAVAQRLDARPFESLDAACAAVSVQAVDVRLPHHLHRLGAELAAKRGLAFLIEKPLAVSLAEAREIAPIAGEVGPSCGVAESYAFSLRCGRPPSGCRRGTSVSSSPCRSRACSNLGRNGAGTAGGLVAAEPVMVAVRRA